MMNLSDTEPEIDFDDESSAAEKILKTGFLVKQGGSRKTWKKRWFVLTNNYLKYFKTDKNNENPQGIIYLRAVNNVQRTEDGKEASAGKQTLVAFEVKTPERVYVICGQAESEVNSWIDAIRAALPNHGTDLQPAEVIKTGYLTKQGGQIKSWKRRWFILRKDNLLAYYKDKDLNVLGTIDLEKVTEVRVASEKLGKEFAFELITNDRTYGMFASSREEMEEWMHTLLSIVGHVIDENGVTPHETKPRSGSAADAFDDDDEGLTLDEINNFIRSDTKIVKEGYLTKQGGSIKSWKRRWFVLREATLAYYRDEKDTRPLGLIALNNCRSFELAAKKVSKSNAFEVTTSDRTYIISAVNEEEMWDWINVLQEAMAKNMKDGNINSAELRALQKAAELAAQKKAMQLKVIRKAGVRKLAKIQTLVRRTSNASIVKRAKLASKNSKGNINWTATIAASEQKLQANKIKLEEQLSLLQTQGGEPTEELRDQMKAMQLEIDRLSSQLGQSITRDSTSTFEGRIEAVLDDDEDNEDDDTPVAWARAVKDYVPNAYDDSALAFSAGEIIAVTKKASSGQWTGMVGTKKGTFPYRYVEELDADEAKQAKKKFAVGVTENGSAKENPWTEKLDDATRSLFAMYDSDGDGFITKLDFFEFLYEFGKTYLTDQQVERCWVEVDVNKTGLVNCNDFSRGIKKLDDVEFYADWSAD